MSKYLKKILLVSMLIIIIPIIAYAQVSHPASEITPGTFGGLATDAFSFPGNVGIGVTSPTFALDVFNANTQKHAAAVFSSNNPATWIAFQSAGTTGDLPQIGVIGNMLQLQTSGTGQLSITPEGNVGIGIGAPTVNLDVTQNGAIKVGNAFLSSGGDYAHLANNEYFTGSAWVGTAPGALIQLAGQNINFYRHDGQGGHTQSLGIDANGDIQVGGSTINFGSRGHISTNEHLFLLPRNGNNVYVSNSWGGSGSLVVDGDIVAPGNSHNNCYWSGWGCGDIACNPGYFMAGFGTYPASNYPTYENCWGAGVDADEPYRRIYCCQL